MSRRRDGQRGREIEAAFESWRARWPQAYGDVVFVLESHYRDKTPCTLDKAVEDTRKRDYTDAQGRPFPGINNTILPAMRRAILAERPHLRGFLDTGRASHLDVMRDDGETE